MKKNNIKTIDIQARRWFQKTYGNTYFTAQVTVNFGMDDEKRFSIPFTYGYGDHYIQVAAELLESEGLIDRKGGFLGRWCRENGIKLNTSHVDVKRKKDLEV